MFVGSDDLDVRCGGVGAALSAPLVGCFGCVFAALLPARSVAEMTTRERDCIDVVEEVGLTNAARPLVSREIARRLILHPPDVPDCFKSALKAGGIRLVHRCLFNVRGCLGRVGCDDCRCADVVSKKACDLRW